MGPARRKGGIQSSGNAQYVSPPRVLRGESSTARPHDQPPKTVYALAHPPHKTQECCPKMW